MRAMDMLIASRASPGCKFSSQRNRIPVSVWIFASKTGSERMRAILCQSLAEASSLFWGKSEIEKPVLPPSAKFILSGVEGFRIDSVEGWQSFDRAHDEV
jgi:hypothetical protein